MIVAGLAVAAATGSIAGAAAAPRPVERVMLGEFGTLTKCRSWIVYRSCRDYGRIALGREAVAGSELLIEYGTATKRYRFPMVRIVIDDGTCTLLGEASTGGDGVDKIVAPCTDVAAPR